MPAELSVQQPAIESNLEHDGVAVINNFLDLGLIARVQEKLSQIPIETFTKKTNKIVPGGPVTMLSWLPVCSAVMEDFEKVDPKIISET